MLFKTIIQGKIEFGTQKAYDMAVKMYTLRAENYFKNDVLFTIEELFFPKELALKVPRLVKQVYGKSYKNTANLLEYIVQFGISGELDIWQIEEGKILDFRHLEPKSDKVAVQQYLKGKTLVKQEGKEEEAILALNKAIEKYDKHAQAYERRGRVNFHLQKYHDALRDYNKCLALDPNNPYAYYGKARVHLHNEDKEDAIDALDFAIKKSVALQAIHWKSRRLKGGLHLEFEQFEKAEFELKLFTKRKFTEDNPNFHWKRHGYFIYGQTLLGLEKFNESVEAFENALEIELGKENLPDSTVLRFRGIAKQKAGQNGFIKDIKDAAEMGDEKAAELLKAIA